MSYQSPIFLNDDDLIKINKDIIIYGKNNGAIYNKYNKTFNVVDKLVLKTNDKKYRLMEYHFHIPSEHYLNNKRYSAEVHYIFEEKTRRDEDEGDEGDEDYKHEDIPLDDNIYDFSDSDDVMLDLCSNKRLSDKNILVLVNLIRNNRYREIEDKELCKDDFEKFPNIESYNDIDKIDNMRVRTPNQYYEYDGTENNIPMRWIVDNDIIEMNVDKIIPYAKTARPLQDRNGRIILFNNNDNNHHDYNDTNYDN
jgi:hypothetical protein